MGQDLAPECRPEPEHEPAIKVLCEKLLPIVRNAARECGYAIGLHGSMVRDLDLIAAPWTDDAVSSDILIDYIRTKLNEQFGVTYARRPQHASPHGRVCANFYFQGRFVIETRAGAHPFIDLSIMPQGGK